MSNDKLAWLEIPVADLSSDNQKLYASLKAAREQTAKIKASFEAAVRKQAASMVPEGNELVFSYRYGNIAVALVPQQKPKASAKNVFKLSK